MKVLFASAAHTPDFAGNFLWRALQDFLSADNVADATDGTALRGRLERQWANDRPILWRGGLHRVPLEDEDDFDILVATSTFLRDHDRDWLNGVIGRHLKRRRDGGKVVWFETLDGARDVVEPPPGVDAVFRREIDPAVQYPYEHKPLPLFAAAPEEWFDDPDYGWTDQKPYDVFNVSNAVTTGHPTRWQSLSPTFCTSRRTHSLAGAGVLQPGWVYLHVLRSFKLVVVAPGGEGAFDNSRIWETIACGGIPIFVEPECRPKWPWFTGDQIFECPAATLLPAVIEYALDSDLDMMRLRLKEQALEYHTARARAQQFLELVEADAWRNPTGPWRW